MSKQYVGIVCARLVGTGALYQQLGDSEAAAIVSRVFERLFETVHKENGRISETVGEELVASFGDVEHAARAASAMRTLVDQEGPNNGYSETVGLRAAVEFGQVSISGSGMEGEVIDRASRLAGRAGVDQILMTQSSAEQMSAAMRRCTRPVDIPMPSPESKKQIVELYRDDPSGQRDSEGSASQASASLRDTLRLIYRSSEVEVTENRPSVVLGRSPICDIKMEEELASRQHVRIERRETGYFLVDQSTNGTYVRGGDGQEHFVSQEAYPVEVSLDISLGRSFADDPEEVVRLERQTVSEDS